MNRLLLDSSPLSNPIRQQNMRKVEKLLLDGNSHDIATELGLGQRQIQRINKDLNDVYGGDNKVECHRSRQNGTTYQLSNTHNIIFPELLLDANDREYMLALYQLIVNIGQTLPTGGILGKTPGESYDCFKGKIDIGSSSDKVKKNLILLYQPLMNEKNVRITYNGNAKKIEISPYCVKTYNNKWYLFGYKLPDTIEGNPNEWENFDLNLIDQIEESTSGRGFKPCKTDLNDYYSSQIGFYTYKDRETKLYKTLEQVKQEIEVVEFRIADPKAKTEEQNIKLKQKWGSYIEHNPLHKSQRVKSQDSKGNKTFEIRVNVTPNLFNRLRFYGAEIEILKPKTLRNQMALEASKLNDIYNTKLRELNAE